LTEGEDAGAEAGGEAGASVGSALSKAREGLGFSVADVAQQLKLAPRQIEALEQDRYDLLPAGTFARGMLRAYARLLKLDPAPLAERIAARTATPDNAAAVASARRPIPITDSRRRMNLVYAALSVAILLVIAGVVFEWQRESSSAAGLSFVPAAAQAPAETQRTEIASAVAAPNLSPLAAVESPAPAAAPVVPAPAAAIARATPEIRGAGGAGTRRIVLKFERSSWVEIRGRDGKPLISQLNPGGTEQTVEGRPPFAVVIGNAQYVRLSYDDKPVDLSPHVKVEVARFTLD
jgi:cytoskeleton protein RodZ